MFGVMPSRILPATGFAHFAGFADEAALATVTPLFEALGNTRAGHRIEPQALSCLPVIGELQTLIAGYLGPTARPVRGLLFDKHAAGNWSLGWHQDRTIEVQRRIDVPGYGPWTVKSGRQHVAPPAELLARMMTVRLHVDPVDQDNAPLIVAPGSHRHGLIPETNITSVVERCGRHLCQASRGDLWVYASLILHASDVAQRPRHRRVLQIDFSADALPDGLEWATAV